jgi:GR25 family glycosyltransferase involved in LPS biosynthesis
MSDDDLKSFFENGTLTESIRYIDKQIQEQHYNIAYIVGYELVKLFPTNIELATLTIVAGLKLQKKVECYALCQKLSSQPGVNDTMKSYIYGLQKDTIDSICNNYTYYNKEIVQKILKKHKSKTPIITLTITTCKRLSLFQDTMNSFLNCCLDLDLIDEWICVDDNSSEEDREKMKELYPFFTFIFKSEKDKGHPQSMNIILNAIKSPFFFHMEDDWKFFCQKPYLTQCLEVLSQDSQIGQCLLNKNYGETPEHYAENGGFYKHTHTGMTYVIHEYYGTEEGMKKFVDKYGPCPNCAYWPHFSFRPSLIRTGVLKRLGEFNTFVSHFEREYAERYIKAGFYSAFLDTIHCMHTGRLTAEINDETKLNAYKLNNELQFSGKENTVLNGLETYVINLDRRTDRWTTFVNNNSHIVNKLNIKRYSAVDGSRLEPTEQLQRIFDGNDYNMRSGMVACAMSQIALYIQLLESNSNAYFIMEDDVELCPNFFERFCTVLSSLENYDICYLSYHLWPQYNNPEFFDKTKKPVCEKWGREQSLRTSIGGTSGYIITRQGAKKLLDFLNTTGMTNAIDTMQQKSADILDVYYCIPQLAYAECCTTNPSKDTDIQNNFTSLTIPVSDRLNRDIQYFSMFGKVETTTDYDTAKSLVNIKEVFCVIYSGVDAISLQTEFTYSYPLSTSHLIILTQEPSEEIKEQRFFQRLLVNGKYDISRAIKYKSKNNKIIPLSNTTHVLEAIQRVTPYTPCLPFDTIDGNTIDSIIDLTIRLANLSKEEIPSLVKSLCEEETEILTLYNGERYVRSKKYDISFVRDKVEALTENYIQKFTALYDLIHSEENLSFIICTRWPIIPIEKMEELISCLSKYNPNIEILCINGYEGELSSKYVRKVNIDFPVNLRVSGWPANKIDYDQKIFRVAITEPISRFLL